VTDCYIAALDKNVILNVNIKDVNIPNNTQSILYVKEDNSINENPQEIPLTFIKKESNAKNYDMKLDLKKSLDADLNEKSGIVNINNEKKTYILSFRTNSSNLDYEYMPSTNKPYKKESSSGLSGGSIVAIILPCIAALLAVLGLAFFLSKSSGGAAAASTIPMENMSNTIGVNSSTNVVSK